jgi:hypothetical protein
MQKCLLFKGWIKDIVITLITCKEMQSAFLSLDGYFFQLTYFLLFSAAEFQPNLNKIAIATNG